MSDFDKIVVVVRPTALDELVARFGSEGQARFYIERSGANFSDYENAHKSYQHAKKFLANVLPRDVRTQWIDRSFLPTFLFGPNDLVATLGQDGLVVNVAKYLSGQRVLAFNPDKNLFDGVLLPFLVYEAGIVFVKLKKGQLGLKRVVMAKAELNDGQSLFAVNDLFIGQKTHVSARYRIKHRSVEEDQSSSGIIVSTGAGSTGWLRSIYQGASAIASAYSTNARVKELRTKYAFDWESESLVFSVREPFVSKTSSANLVLGSITTSAPLVLVSRMPKNGVIFGDGVEEDFLNFNSGAIATISPSEKRLNLLVN